MQWVFTAFLLKTTAVDGNSTDKSSETEQKQLESRKTQTAN